MNKPLLPEITKNVHQFLKERGIFSLLSGGECPHLEGIWGAGSAAVLAAIIQENPDKHVVVVTPTQKVAQNFQDDFTLFGNRPIYYFPWLNDSAGLLATEEKKRTDDEDVFSTVIPDASVGERLRVLHSFLNETKNDKKVTPSAVVAPIQALLMPCPKPETLAGESLTLEQGDTVAMETITEWLVTHGFQNTTAVEFPGEFFARGGLIDIYAIDWERPLRIEFFGDEIDSIREFDLETQRSLNTVRSVRLGAFTSMFDFASGRVPMTAYLSTENTLFFLLEPEEIQLQGRRFYQAQERRERLFTSEEVLREVLRFPLLSGSALGTSAFGDNFHLSMETVERFSGDFSKVREELEHFGLGQTVYLLCPNEAEENRLKTIFSGTYLEKKKALKYRIGTVSEGFRLLLSHEMVLSSSALFHRNEIRRSAIERKQAKNKDGKDAKDGGKTGGKDGKTQESATKIIDSFTDLREGDYVVHVSYGIALYRGLVLLEPLKNRENAEKAGSIQTTPEPKRRIIQNGQNAGGAEEHMLLEFRDGVFVYVPISKIALVQKYICSTTDAPKLSVYGGKAWERQKKNVAESVQDMACEMLDVQAERLARPGIVFPVNTPLQNEFDALFPYTETPDQLATMEAIRADMNSARPMDRLLCGDVGFGKTEMAMRAAFAAVEAGYQVGIMVPTTILADQHLRSFTQRMATFPIIIRSISRFSTPAEQKETLKQLEDGQIDILIGTHRLASPDVKFRNLGLVIIDEEQRFGVEMKESLKRIRKMVDVLTMTATPIPRTLHLSLLGLRDISSLETPPLDRRAIETHVTRFQEHTVRNAIMREIDRNGQVYFIHNRVKDIEEVAERLKELVPEARIAIGHAQMPERQLEQVMRSFINHEVDILLSTTIVESGLDIPNANTIFIDEANRYGLAELHQLRGRVGRFKNHAYCYLLVKKDAILTETALRRLKAIEEFAHLGSGFHIAMRDLEIRGAGNILGTKQSGEIAAVGYELYCDLLDEAVRRLRRMPPRESVDVDVRIPLTAYLPHQYVSDMRVKMELYRRLSRLTRLEHLEDFAEELRDRFGPLPPQAQLLLKLYKVRILAHQRMIYAISRDGNFLVFEFHSRKALEMIANRRVGYEEKTLRFADEHSAYLPIDGELLNSASDSEILLNYAEMLLQE